MRLSEGWSMLKGQLQGAGGAARMPLGVATIGCVLSSTLLTLFVVPNFFVVIENLRRRRG
ncbi:hypothetical protein EBR21_05040 [bacterium]|nr:hypothetical protein [bacterium]